MRPFFIHFTIFMFLLSSELSARPSTQLYPDSKNAQISLLTYSPGEDLYSIFGHSAIRVSDTVANIDKVYNYGTFDFDQPNFYLLFLKGDLDYFLSRVPFEYVKQTVNLENRSLIETPLNLSLREKEKVVNFLETNLRPENRIYKYDFQGDNCSTRIIDLLNSEIDDTLTLNPQVLPVRSFRRLLDPYLEERPWTDFGVDLLLGLQSDRVAKKAEPAFLPDYLHLIVKNYMKTNSNDSLRLAQPDIVLVQNFKTGKRRILSPKILFWSLAILLLISVFIDSYFRPLFRFVGNVLLLVAGLLSILLIILWIFPTHQIFTYNTDILWANPMLLLVFLLRKKNKTTLKTFLLLFTLICTIFGILTTIFIEANTGLTAIAVMLSIHLLDLVRENKLKDHFSSH